MIQDKRRRIIVLFGFLGVLAVVLMVGWRARSAARVAEEPLSEFLQRAQAGELAVVTLGEGTVEYQLKDGQAARAAVPLGYVAAHPDLIGKLLAARARVTVRPAAAADPLVAVPIALAAFALIGFVVHRQTGRVSLVGGRVDGEAADGQAVMFADVAGVDEAKEEVREIVDFLREPGRFTALGGRIPRGVLLVGPPGTGKTLLARSMAGEAGVPFLFASGADFVEMYAGVGAARVRRLFKEARRHQSCIVFIDEIDCLGRRRGSQSLSHEEREQALNQLLVEMDGFDSAQRSGAPSTEGHRGVVVIGATNRQDILDPALLRPGRFDRQVTVGCPDLKGRQQILQVHARKLRFAEHVELTDVARGTPGFSGADLANLMNEAALLAARAGREAVTSGDLLAARDKVMMGAERRSLVMSERERQTCAYHEAGHAVVAALSPGADPLYKVSIVPRGRALGVTMQLPEGDRHTHGRGDLLAQIAVLMGGRAAEEIFLGDVTTGAANDIERATEIAQRMVCEMGMSPLGPLLLRKGSGPAGEGGQQRGLLSEAMAQRVDEEVRAVVVGGHQRATEILRGRQGLVRAMAERLLEVETLDIEEIQALLAAHPA